MVSFRHANRITKFTNQQLADIFTLIGDLLEIKGEIIYKTLAYRKAADLLTSQGRQVYDIWQEGGKLTEIPGVGKAIAEKIDELFRTGQLGFLERLKQEIPVTLVELLRVPGRRSEEGQPCSGSRLALPTWPSLEAAAPCRAAAQPAGDGR